MKRAIVTGMIAAYPVGGVFWDYIQYALGLEKLGYEVYYLEDTGWQTYDPDRGEYGDDCSYSVKYLAETLKQFPTLSNRWHFFSMQGQSHGVDRKKMVELIRDADLFINVSNSCLLREDYMPCKTKVLIDTDPGWNHFVNFPKWDKNPGWLGSRSWRDHDHFFTYAESIGRPECALPDLGIRWLTTRPPVVLDQWKTKRAGKLWTTVMTWNNFKEPIRHEGKVYGTKEMEFGKFENLPAQTKASFELATGGSGVPRERWQQAGWHVIDSHSISRTPEDYRDYIQNSRGEFSAAKNVYVETSSGWFSCRTVCYLAAGKPAVVQDTGFSQFIPSGKGLFAVTNLNEAMQAVEAVEKDYAMHQKSARDLAHDYFSAEKVLGKMLADIGI